MPKAPRLTTALAASAAVLALSACGGDSSGDAKSDASKSSSTASGDDAKDVTLAEPEPAADLLYPRAVWNYAQGVANVRKGNAVAAETNLKALAAHTAGVRANEASRVRITGAPRSPSGSCPKRAHAVVESRYRSNSGM